MACRRCGQIVRKVLFGFCMMCSMLPHGADDEFSRVYSVDRIEATARPSAGSSSGSLTLTPDPVRVTVTLLAPTVTVGVPPASAST